MKSLISVTNLEESIIAIANSCDILDVKDPKEGSLGAPYPVLLGQIVKANTPGLPLSIALGDVSYFPNSIAFSVLGALQMKPEYIKLGLRYIKTEAEAADILEKANRVISIHALSPVKLVAGSFADYRNIGAVSPYDTINAAVKTGVKVCLIDTVDKSGKSLFDFMPKSAISDFVGKCHENGIMAAIAGSVRLHHLQDIADSGADVVGVRGAICKNNNRSSELSPALLKDFLETVRNL